MASENVRVGRCGLAIAPHSLCVVVVVARIKGFTLSSVKTDSSPIIGVRNGYLALFVLNATIRSTPSIVAEAVMFDADIAVAVSSIHHAMSKGPTVNVAPGVCRDW